MYMGHGIVFPNHPPPAVNVQNTRKKCNIQGKKRETIRRKKEENKWKNGEREGQGGFHIFFLVRVQYDYTGRYMDYLDLGKAIETER